jgi:hypothetical protein
MAIFDHELKDREFESGITSAAAVLGLEVERGGWRSPDQHQRKSRGYQREPSDSKCQDQSDILRCLL